MWHQENLKSFKFKKINLKIIKKIWQKNKYKSMSAEYFSVLRKIYN